jgi:hypothetical protein
MSKNEQKIDRYYQKQAREFVDMLHDNKIIDPKFTRKDMRVIENYVAFVFQSGAESAKKVALMLEKIKK